MCIKDMDFKFCSVLFQLIYRALHVSQSLYTCTPTPKHLNSNPNSGVWNTALQIGTQLEVKVNGNNLQKQRLSAPASVPVSSAPLQHTNKGINKLLV